MLHPSTVYNALQSEEEGPSPPSYDQVIAANGSYCSSLSHSTFLLSNFDVESHLSLTSDATGALPVEIVFDRPPRWQQCIGSHLNEALIVVNTSPLTFAALRRERLNNNNNRPSRLSTSSSVSGSGNPPTARRNIVHCFFYLASLLIFLGIAAVTLALLATKVI